MLIAAVLCVLGVYACASNPALAPSGLRAASGDFRLNVMPESFLGAGQSGSFTLDTKTEPDGAVLVTVHAKAVKRLRAFYGELTFDPARYSFAEASPGKDLGPEEELLSLSKLAAPSIVHFGAVLVQPDSKPGLSGDGVLAKLRFVPAAGGAFKSGQFKARGVSKAVESNSSKAPCVFTVGSDSLMWYYANQGDYDQNGLVILSDLTPIAVHFRETGPFNFGTARSVIDGDNNGLINLADIMPIGYNYGADATGGYDVFTSQNQSDYPDSNTQAPKVVAVKHFELGNGVGTPATTRLAFSRQMDPSLAGSYFWVRPVDSHGAVGTASALTGNTVANLPVLSMQTPIADGQGLLDDPYIINPSAHYTFHVVQPGLGDVTTAPGTQYFVFPGDAAMILNQDGDLRLNGNTTKSFIVVATTQNGAMASNLLNFHIGPPFYWTETVVDTGTPATNIVGGFSSASTVAGKPAVAYHDATAGSLKYAELDEGVWEIFTIDMGVDLGEECSLYGHSYGAIISYHDEMAGELKFAQTESTDPGPGDWHCSLVVLGANNTGSRSSISVFNSKPVIAYADNTLHGLSYARATVAAPQSQADWNRHLIDTCGDYCDIKLDRIANLPAIAYRDTNSGDLKYARALVAEPSSFHDWAIMTVASTGDVGYRPDLDSYGASFDMPFLTYYDATEKTIMSAYANANPNATADWQTRRIGGYDNTDLGLYSSISGSATGFWVAFYDQTHRRLRFTVSNSYDPINCKWNWGYAGSATDVGAYCSLSWTFTDSELTPWVSYMDEGGGDLRVAFGNIP
jgi:hypothetical protein